MLEEEYLKQKEHYENFLEENNNFVEENFVDLFKSFNKNFSFNFDIKEIKPKSKAGYIVFSYNIKNYTVPSLFVHFNVSEDTLRLSYTEDSQEKGYSDMVVKSKLYQEVISLFQNFNIEIFEKTVNALLDHNSKLSQIKKDYLKIEEEYFEYQREKYNRILFSVISKVNSNEAIEEFQDYINKKQTQLLEDKEKRVTRVMREDYFSCFVFNLDFNDIIFKEKEIKVELDKNDKLIFFVDRKKTSLKKCKEIVCNQFLYNNKRIESFKDFQNIEPFKESAFKSYSSFGSVANLQSLVKPFQANVLVQDF